MNAVDTNVLVYAFDDQHIAKRAKAIELIDGLTGEPGSSVMIWQVACEFLAVLRRWHSLGRVSPTDVEAYCQEMLGYFSIVCPVPEVIPAALRLAARYSLSHWDSLLVAAALEAGVDTLYTEDLQSGARYESLMALNLFA